MKFILTLSLMAATCTLATGIATAATPTSGDLEPSMVVRYTELDLTTQHGAKALYSRIVNAAESVCPAVDMNNLSAKDKRQVCVQRAVNAAVSSVSSPMLAATAAAHAKPV